MYNTKYLMQDNFTKTFDRNMNIEYKSILSFDNIKTYALEWFNSFSPHRKQKEIIKSIKRFNIVVAGRRSGKTMLGRFLIVFKALSLENSVNWWVSPIYKQAKREFRKTIKEINERGFKNIIKNYNKSDLIIELGNGSEIQYWGCDNEDSLRGEGIDYLVMDECATIDDKVYFEVLRPALSDKNGKGLMIGTPKGFNWFHELYRIGIEEKDDDIYPIHFKTVDNTKIDGIGKEVEKAKINLPENIFRQEYLAEFIADSSIVFAGLEVVIKDYEISTNYNNVYYIGIDLAKKIDYTVILVMDVFKHVIEMERFQNSWLYTKNRIMEFAHRYKNHEMIIDATGGYETVHEDLHREGIRIRPFVFTANSKNELINKLIVDIEQKRISIGNRFKTLIDEMREFSYIINKKGKITYNAKYGKHDDCVIALALANYISPFIPLNQEKKNYNFSLKVLGFEM